MRRLVLLLTILLAATATARAQTPPKLSFPVDCRVGQDCWIFGFVDTRPGPGYRDFNGGYRTYDEHKGTDIALKNTGDVARDVAVTAAAAGTVLGARDGLPDNPPGEPHFPDGKECGNGVRIDHGNGWTTQYCHLKRGSIRVKSGQTVKAGTLLGSVGGSGAAETPHLHLQLEHNSTVVDPFTGLAGDGTKIAPGPMWKGSALDRFGAYRQSFLRHIGFASNRTDLAQALKGAPAQLPHNGPGLVLYATIYGISKGEPLKFEIFGPSGAQIFVSEEAAKKSWARFFNYAGKKTPKNGWPKGLYRGRVSLGGQILGEAQVELK